MVCFDVLTSSSTFCEFSSKTLHILLYVCKVIAVTSPTSQALHVLHLASRPCIVGWKNSLWWSSLLQQVTKFRSSYSFGLLLRILLRAVNLFSFSHIVSSDSSFNIHIALYFVKYPSRAAQNSPAGRGLKTPGLKRRSSTLRPLVF